MTFAPRPNAKNRPWQQGDEESVSFGTWLRRQREVREISLREIADDTKISLRYLEAFEQDRFDALPATVFAKGFLRQYAQYVGLDPDEVINHFLSAQQALEPEDEEPEPEPAKRPVSGWLYNLLLVLVVVAVIVLVALLAFHTERRNAAVRSAPSTVADPSTEPPAPGTPAEAPAAQAAAQLEPPPPPVSAVEPEAPLRVTLDFTANCWVEIVVDGRERIQREIVQGESLQLAADETVVMTLGNAGGVEVRVNGHPYDLGRNAGQVARGVRIDLETAQALAEAS